MFKDFGIVSFVPSTKVDSFVDGLKDGKIRGTRCKKCSEFYLPPRAECPQCMTEDMDWVDVGNEGKLVTFTKLFYGPTGFEDRTPYVLGIVDLGEGGRLLGLMEGLDEESISIGMKVKVIPKVVDERVILSVVKGD